MSSDCFLMAGVMGWPVMHSRSPKIHNYWFAKYGLAGTYVPLAIRPHGLGAALRALAPLGFAGCNLTIPHKETAVEIVDRIDSPARRIGAINCVVVAPDGTLDGSNNDGLGYIESILEYEPGWRADLGPIVVIGAGGAARAILVALAEWGARDIRLVNRGAARARGSSGRRSRRCHGKIATPGSMVRRCSSTPRVRGWQARPRSILSSTGCRPPRSYRISCMSRATHRS